MSDSRQPPNPSSLGRDPELPLSGRSDAPTLGGAGQTPGLPEARPGRPARPSSAGVGATGAERPASPGASGMSGAETNDAAPGGAMVDPSSRAGRPGGDVGRNG